jgi:branched-chain amino acid transport system permease protein
VFAVASAIAGAAGCLISVAYGTVTPFLGSNLLLVSFVVLVLAGIGSVRGAMICGLFVGVIETVTAGLISAQTKEAVLFIILFIVLLVKPQGIFATSATERD